MVACHLARHLFAEEQLVAPLRTASISVPSTLKSSSDIAHDGLPPQNSICWVQWPPASLSSS